VWTDPLEQVYVCSELSDLVRCGVCSQLIQSRPWPDALSAARVQINASCSWVDLFRSVQFGNKLWTIPRPMQQTYHRRVAGRRWYVGLRQPLLGELLGNTADRVTNLHLCPLYAHDSDTAALANPAWSASLLQSLWPRVILDLCEVVCLLYCFSTKLLTLAALSSKRLCNGIVSVCLSVCAVDRQRRAAGLLLSGHRSIAAGLRPVLMLWSEKDRRRHVMYTVFVFCKWTTERINE